MTSPRTSAAIAFVAATTAAPLAHARGGYTSTGSPETPEDLADDQQVITRDHGLVWEGTAGFEVGTFHTGAVYNLALGLAFDGGIRLDRLALLGQYSILWLENPNSTTTGDTGSPDVTGAPGMTSAMQTTPSGLVQRIGAAARYSVARGMTVHKGLGLRGDFWLEGGVGEQFIRWDDGGYLNRPDVDLAFGAQLDVRGKHHHGGYFLGMRATLAPPPAGAPSLTAPPTCAGPCDGPTRPIAIDRSFLLVFAADFGG